MSEESTLINEVGSGGNVGTATGSSYFDDFQLVDDNGNAVNENKQTAKPKEESKPVEKKPDEKAEQQQPQQPTGFVTRFYKQDDKGASSFDAEGALSFINPTEGSKWGFQYQPRAVAQPQPQGAQPQQQQQPDVPVWQKRLNERNDYQKSLMDGLLYPISHVKQQLGANMDEATSRFIAYQEQIANEKVRELMMKYDAEQEEKRYKEQEERGNKITESAKLRNQAMANESALVQHLGGKEQYDQFMFGTRDAQGKFQKGYATDLVYKLFDMQNPDIKNPTQEDYDNWWYKFASDINNIQMVYQFGMANLQRQLWPDLVKHVGYVKEQTQQQQKQGRQRSPTTMTSATPKRGQGANADLQGFFSMKDRNFNTV